MQGKELGEVGVLLDCTGGGPAWRAVELGGETWLAVPSGKAFESRLLADAFARNPAQSTGHIRLAAAKSLCGRDFGKACPI